MRIEVVAADTISQQARAYAEYRVFAALTQLGWATMPAALILASQNVPCVS